MQRLMNGFGGLRMEFERENWLAPIVLLFRPAHAQRDSYLDGEIQAVHVTPLGLCLHDFAVTPRVPTI